MSTSYDKVVKLACKPKAAPPKTKYMDPIIAATWSDEGAVHDVCKALSPRFREPNAIVVFKALIVLHTMIRNGATDNVLQYLSSSDVLRLRNISAGHWEGYAAPENLQQYAVYLDTRIRAYRDLKHDAIRVQSETNRDMRNSQAIEESKVENNPKGSRRKRGGGSSRNDDDSPPAAMPQRSKTIMGRKLRVMTVEKGLLRETKVVQKMVDALVECRFYLDDLEDELNITALRMLVKDLLILFQACNEGVINVLEHYFEMSKIDAKEALSIYRHFCKETERVVEYLGVAKKLQNLLSVPIPNLRHAPVSLAGSLEEYLNDPNFEQNRIEYKTNKEAAERNAKAGVKLLVKPAVIEKAATSNASEAPQSSVPSSSAQPTAPKSAGSQAMMDFFTSIEAEQQPMFNPQTNSPSTAYFQQQATYNPFAQTQMMTGAPFPQQPLQMQATSFLQPQQTGNPFAIQQSQQMPQQPQAFGNFLQAQPTGFLQPQTTGANPFRQSTLFPQTTGMPSFGMQAQGAPSGPTNPFPVQNQSQPSTNPFPPQTQMQTGNPFPMQSTNPFPGQAQSQYANPFPGQSQQSAPSGGTSSFGNTGLGIASPSAQPFNSVGASSAPARPASAPLKAIAPSSTDLQPVKTHQTGSRNPFGVPVSPAPPVPKAPTLMELAMGMGGGSQPSQSAQPPSQQQPSQSQLEAFGSGTNGQGGSSMSNIASSFSLENDKPPLRSSTMPFNTGATPTATGSTFTSSIFSSLATQPTSGTSVSSTSPSIAVSPPSTLQPQMTGFGGLKPFKPSSSFGAALLESLPPIPQSTPTTPATSPPSMTNGISSPGNNGTAGFSTGAASASTGMSTLGAGLRPQMTGAAGAANPFRASMFPGLTGGGTFGSGGGSGGGTSSFLNSAGSSPALSGTPTGFGGGPSAFSGAAGTSSFLSGGMFGLGAGSGGGMPGQNPQQQQQQQNTSLI